MLPCLLCQGAAAQGVCLRRLNAQEVNRWGSTGATLISILISGAKSLRPCPSKLPSPTYFPVPLLSSLLAFCLHCLSVLPQRALLLGDARVSGWGHELTLTWSYQKLWTKAHRLCSISAYQFLNCVVLGKSVSLCGLVTHQGSGDNTFYLTSI